MCAFVDRQRQPRVYITVVAGTSYTRIGSLKSFFTQLIEQTLRVDGNTVAVGWVGVIDSNVQRAVGVLERCYSCQMKELIG